MIFFSKKQVQPVAPPQKKPTPAPPASNLQALEPRIMFDAAGMLDFNDAVNDFANAPESTDSHDSENENQEILALFKDYTPPSQNIIKEIIFVDSAVEDYQSLLGSTPSDSKTFILNTETDAVEQITLALGSYRDLNAVHIVSHGRAGQLDFASSSLNNDTLGSHSADLSSWSKSLSDNADIMIYGCDVAAGIEGENFINQISQLTGADVAASTDTTGAADKGGDWDLEKITGGIETSIAFTTSTQTSWQGTLDTATLVSVDSSETPADASTWEKGSVTHDGRYVAFASSATNLVSGDTNAQSDIFVRDTFNGNTARVSVDSSGTEANGSSWSASISDDGRFVTYYSSATNLIAADTNAVTDIFVHDRDTDNDGIFDEAGFIATVRVSVNSSGVESNSSSINPNISNDGRFISFSSNATNLVATDTNAMQDIFVHDRDADNDGIFDEVGAITTIRVSVDSSGTEANNSSYAPVMSADGRFISFYSSATNLVGGDTNTQNDVFVHDRDADNDGIYDEVGAIATIRVSVDSSGAEANNPSYTPDISSDGRFIAFESTASNLVAGDTNAVQDIFVHDRDADNDGIYDEAGAITTKRVSVASDGTEGNNWSMSPSISDGGHLVAFTSNATNLVANDVNGTTDVFIHDTFAEGTTLGTDITVSGMIASGAVIAGDGRHLVLTTGVSLVGADINGFNDLYIIDRNDAPIANPAGESIIHSIMENDTNNNGTTVGDIVRPIFVDFDDYELSESGIAVIGVDNTNGTWQYSTDFGSTWNNLTGLSDSSATLLSGEIILAGGQVSNTTDIAASQVFINGNGTAAITLTTALNNGLNMEGAWNLVQALNDPTLNHTAWVDLTTLTYSSSATGVAASSGNISFDLNGIAINVAVTFGDLANITNTALVAAVNAQTSVTGVVAEVGDGTNGAAVDTIILKNNTIAGLNGIRIDAFQNTATGTGVNLTSQMTADATHNTGSITLFSHTKYEITTSAGDDSILNLIGLGGGTASTSQTGDTAGDGKIFVNSGPDLIRFVPNTDYTGTAGITYRTWDQTDSYPGATGVDVSINGANSAFSTTTTTAEITTNPTIADTLVPNGPEFQVNTYTTNHQAGAFLTELSGGNIIVTWSSTNQDGSNFGVYGQLYDSAGAAIGGEFIINTTTTDAQVTPPIAALNDGGFVVTWTSDNQDGALGGIYGQRYNSTGTPVGSEFQVNTTTSDNQHSSSVASLGNGGFVVAWTSLNQDGSGAGVYGQLYKSSGVASGNEFLINSTTTDAQTTPTIARLNDGGFVVVWASNNQDGSFYGVYGQRYDGRGNLIGGEFRINAYTTLNQQTPSIEALNDGGFVVAWESEGQDGSLNGIYAQRYSVNGSAVGSEFMVNTQTTDSQSLLRPVNAIAALEDGGFVITWSSNNQDGSSYGVYGQRYDANNNAVGNEFLINTYTLSDQKASAVTSTSDGGFIVTWESDSQDGNGLGIYAQRYKFNDAPVLDNSGTMTLTAIAEDNFTAAGDTIATIIASAGGDRVTDSNTNPVEGIAVTGVDNTNGSWEYSTDTGSTWTAFSAVSTSSATLLADTASTLIRFVPNAEYSGLANITFQAWDQTTGLNGDVGVDVSINGGSTSFSTASESATVTINAVGDTPTVANITTNEDTQSGGIILTRNANDGTEVTHFKITSITGGTLYQNNGITQINDNDYITFAEGNAGLKFTPSANSNTNGSFQVESSEDGTSVAAQSSAVASTITVTPVGDTPTVTNSITSENTQTGLIIVDRNAADSTEVTHFRISNIANGTLYQSDGTTVINNGDYITFAQGNSGLKFTPTTNSTVTGTFDVEASQDGTSVAAQSGTATSSITISSVNNAPTFTALDATPTFTENGAAVILDSNATIADPELDALNGGNGNYNAATLTLSRNGGPDATDLFTIPTGGNLTLSGTDISAAGNVIATYTNVSGQLQIIFTDANGTIPTTALVNEVLQTVTYSNSVDEPPAAVQIDYSLNDGNSGSQGAGGALAASGSITVTLTAVNDVPVVSSTGATINYTESDAPTIIDSTITVADPDNTTLQSATIQIAPGYTDGEDVLSFSPVGAISGIWNATTATLTLTGTETIANYQTALRSVTYENLSTNPNTAPRTINFSVNDGSVDSPVANSTVTVTSVVPPPPPTPTAPIVTASPPPEAPPAPLQNILTNEPPATSAEPPPLERLYMPTNEPLGELTSEPTLESPSSEISADALPPEPAPEAGAEPDSAGNEPTTELHTEAEESDRGLEDEPDDDEIENEETEEELAEEEGDEELLDEEAIIEEAPVTATQQTAPTQNASTTDETQTSATGMSAQLAAEADKATIERTEIIKVLDEAFKLLQCN